MTKVLSVLVAALLAWALAVTTAQADEHGRWQQLENNPSCAVWSRGLQFQSTVTWSGACVNDKAQGRGVEVWRWNDGEWRAAKYEGEMKDGKQH